MTLHAQAQAAVDASRVLTRLTTAQKNAALLKIAEGLMVHQAAILAANAEDVARFEAEHPGFTTDRLLLTPERVAGMAREVRNVVALDDEVGKIIDERGRPNGLKIQRVRCPLGVVGMIYESRPNVTVDAAVLCLKSSNAVMLKGGSEALASNRALVEVMKQALEGTDVPAEAIQFLDTTDRAVTAEFLKLKGFLDVIIPRGGRGLIEFVSQNATVPVIETGASVVHTYVDEFADMEKAVAVVVNAKTRRVTICNTLDTILVHESIAARFLEAVAGPLHGKGVELRCDPKSFSLIKNSFSPVGAEPSWLKPAREEDFGKEFLDTILAIKVVASVDEALEHIAAYSLKHSEAIVSENREVAERFLREVDAAVVYWNASTQFSDGAEFGLGAEIGISTQKLHVRGPFALEGLTSMKWVVRGEGQIRA